jgi:uncharacterized membrane protein YczE
VPAPPALLDFGRGSMRRLQAYLVALIFFAIGLRVVALAIAPFVPIAIGGLVVAGIVGRLYYRRW